MRGSVRGCTVDGLPLWTVQRPVRSDGEEDMLKRGGLVLEDDTKYDWL